MPNAVQPLLRCAALLMVCLPAPLVADETLLGHWPLAGDTDDHSGHDNHATNHGADLTAIGPSGKKSTAARFDGIDDWLTVPASESLRLTTNEFSIAVWIHTDAHLDDVIGDIAGKFDPDARRGFNLSVKHNVGVTDTPSNVRNVHFGIDNGRLESSWTDHGRPGNNVCVFSLAVFEGNLYAGTCEPGADEAGHVYRFDGGAKWIDLGSPDRCNAVTSLAACNGRLYAAVSKYRLRGSALDESPNTNPGGRIYRYEGPGRWTDCGRIGDAAAVSGLVVYRGKLYASAMYTPGLYRYDGGTTWAPCGNPKDKRVEALAVYNGHLYATGWNEAAVYRYDGNTWTHLGLAGENTQTYGFGIYRGDLYVTTWPSGRVFRYGGGQSWADTGRLGEERETMPLVVYNGKLYSGTLPGAGVYRYDGDNKWVSIGRVDTTPDVKYRRAWSMAVYQGRLFVGALPSGRVKSIAAGTSATHDHELDPGWRHIVAVKGKDRLALYLDARRVATSTRFDAKDYDLTNDAPFTIGRGAHDRFNGRLTDLRLYGRALAENEITRLFGSVKK